MFPLPFEFVFTFIEMAPLGTGIDAIGGGAAAASLPLVFPISPSSDAHAMPSKASSMYVLMMGESR
jgi:hypothetical protein